MSYVVAVMNPRCNGVVVQVRLGVQDWPCHSITTRMVRYSEGSEVIGNLESMVVYKCLETFSYSTSSDPCYARSKQVVYKQYEYECILEFML